MVLTPSVEYLLKIFIMKIQACLRMLERQKLLDLDLEVEVEVEVVQLHS